MSNDNFIVVFESVSGTFSSDGRPIQARGVPEKLHEAIKVSAETLEENFSGFISNVGRLLDQAGSAVGQYSIDKVEIEAMISADGQIGFAGTSVGLSGKTSMKVILIRSGKE